MIPPNWLFSDYKVPGGKLIRLEFLLDPTGNLLADIRLHGDFFLHPEEAQDWMEEALRTCPLEEIENRLSRLIAERNVEAYGFSPGDIQAAVLRALEKPSSKSR